MPKNSLSYVVSEYFQQLFATNPKLKERHKSHKDADHKAQRPGIVVEVTEGEERAGGAAGNRCEVVATWRSGTKSSAGQNEMVAEAMSDTVKTANTRVTSAQSKFSYMVILTEELSMEEPDPKGSRERVLKVPVFAKLK